MPLKQERSLRVSPEGPSADKADCSLMRAIWAGFAMEAWRVLLLGPFRASATCRMPVLPACRRAASIRESNSSLRST